MSSSVFALQVSPSIPPAIKRLDDLAKNFWFAWNPALGQLFRKLDPEAVAEGRRQPALVPALRGSEHPRSRGDRPELHRGVSAHRRGVRRLPRRHAGAAGRARAFRPHRVLLRRVRLARELPDLLRRLGRARRRSLQDGQRSQSAVRRRRALVSARLFPSAHRPQRPADARVSADRPAQRAGVDRAEPRRHRSARELPCAGSSRSRARLESARRARHGVAARYRRARERGRGSADHGQALRRQRRAAAATRGRARHRRRARVARPRPRADGLAHQRGSRRVPRPRAAARVHDGGLPFAAALEATAANTVFTTHTPVSAGHDVFPPERVARQFASFRRSSASRRSSFSSSAAPPTGPTCST